VVWNFAGKQIPQIYRDDMVRLLDMLKNDTVLRQRLLLLLSSQEFEALVSRAQQVHELETYPEPSENRRMVPWPLV
jgi:Trp operon repressor